MRRGQVAMEFITTYGWAMLVILSAIGAITYFGVLRVDILIPERCEVTSDFSCKDYVLYAQASPAQVRPEIAVVLQNTAGTTLVLQRGYMQYDDQTGNAACGRYVWSNDTQTLGPGETTIMVCNPGSGASILMPVGEKVRVTFEFNYSLGADGFTRIGKGEVIATVQP